MKGGLKLIEVLLLFCMLVYHEEQLVEVVGVGFLGGGSEYRLLSRFVGVANRENALEFVVWGL